MAKTYGLMRLGRDAEVRRTPGGDAVVNLSLAYNYGKPNENKERPTQWIDAALWGDRAEKLAPFLRKGSLHLFTIGDIHMEKYTDKDGFEAFKLAGTVLDVELGPKQEGSGSGETPAGATGQRRPAAGATGSQRPASAPAPAPSQGGIDDDDIPF